MTALPGELATLDPMISTCREHPKNVTRPQRGTRALRWCAAGMAEAGPQFRRAGGHLHLPARRTALTRHIAELKTVGPDRHTEPFPVGVREPC